MKSDTTKMLIDKWDEATAFMSSTTQMIKHPLFAAISKREDAIDALIESLREKASINAIIGLGKLTGENPVPPEHRGMVEQMRQDWLEWFEKKDLDNPKKKV